MRSREAITKLAQRMGALIDMVQQYLKAGSLAEKQRLGDALLDALGPDLFHYIQHRCQKGCEDAVQQETWLSLFKSLPGFKGQTDEQFRAWCFRIADRRCADSLRGRKRQREHATDPEELARLAEAGAAVEPAAFATRDLAAQALKLVRKVKPPCYDLLVWRYVLGYDLETIADEMQLDYDTVRMRLVRCLELARKLLSGYE